MTRIAAIVSSLVLIGAVMFGTITAAQAVAPLPSTTPSNTGMVDLPGASGTNSITVRTITQVGNDMWVGGIFNEIDDVNGHKVATAGNLGVFDATSGLLVPGIHLPIVTSSDGAPEVYDSSLGANGILYFAGNFDAVDGATRHNVAAIDPTTGALLPFAPNSGSASSILATPDAVYVGTGKLLSFQLSGAPTPGYNPPQVFIDASLRGHVTIPAFRSIAKLGNTLVSACQCDSLTDSNGTRNVKAIVQINAITGNQNSWAPQDPNMSSDAWGIRAIIHNEPGTNTPAIYLAAGGSDFAEGFDFSTGHVLWKTDCSGSCQDVTWYEGSLIFGGHFNWTASPGNTQCGSDDGPNTSCYFTPKIVAMNATTGTVLLTSGGQPWTEGICCRYNGVWAVVTGNDGSTLYVGGEIDDAGGTWTCHTFQASCLSGKVLQKNYAVFAGPPSGNQTLTVATAGAGSGAVTSNTGGINCGLSCITDIATGTNVTLTATPQGSSTFTGWSGDCTGTGPCVLTMSQAHSVTATFAPASFQLTVVKAGAGTGTVASSPAGITCGTTCSAFFAQNTAVTLTATPGANATFTGWTSSDAGFSCPGTGTCHVTMNQARSVTATFTPTGFALTVTKTGPGTGLITSNPSGINCGATCTFTFGAPTVTLTAVPNGGWVFNGWTGAGCSGTGTCTVTMNAAQSVSADFETAKNLNVTVTGAGTGTVTSAPAGITCTTGTCSAPFLLGSTVTLTATPAANSLFTGWTGADGTGCGTATTCQVTMSAQRNVTATFVAAQTLTVTPLGLGTGTVTSSPAGINCGGTCQANFAIGTPVTLTAIPNPTTSNFTGWGGAGASCPGTSPCTVTMSTSLNVTATFGLQTRQLTVNVGGSGTVTSTTGGINCTTANAGTCAATYPYGTEVELDETPASNWLFTGWSGGGCSGTDTSCVVPMTMDQSVTPTFAHIRDTVTVNLAGSGAGTVVDDQGPLIDCPGTCTASYDRGTTVTLTATASPDSPASAFTGWSGDCTGTGPCVLTMNGAQNVTATFQPLFELTVTSPSHGTITSGDAAIDCGTGGAFCSVSYPAGTTVTLTATPDVSYVFDSWGGDCAGTDPMSTCTVTMGSAKDVSADFEAAESLSVFLTGDGSGTVTSSPARINCVGGAGTCQAPFTQNSTVTLTATPDATSAFTGWVGGVCDGTTTPCQITMSADTDATANFEPTHVLTVQTTGGTAGTVTSDQGAIDCPGACSDSYLDTATVTLTADPGANATFTGWTATGCDATGTTLTCPVTMSTDTTVTAAFAPIQDAVAVTLAGGGTGSVASTPAGVSCPSTCSANFNQASQVTLTATPNAGSTFTGWSGSGCSGTGTCQVTVGATNNVTATFGLAPRQLTVNVSGSGSVTSDTGGINCPAILCSTSYPNGTLVTLTAAAGTGFTFTGWSGTGVTCPGTGTCQVTMNADTSVTATFTQNPQPLNLTVVGVSGGTGSVVSSPSGISCTATCSHSFGAGTPVTLTATPGASTTFVWSGDCSGSSTCQVTMSATHNVTVTFTKSSTTTIDDIDPAVAYNGWFDVADAAANGGFYRMSNVKNDKATWKSPATTSITWISRTGPDQGKATVTIDGANEGTVDLYSTSAASLSKVYAGLANKVHTVVIKVLHTKNASSSGFNVRLDAFKVGTTTTQESDTAIQYDTWKYSVVAKTNGGSYHSASAATAYATVQFTGTSIDWITATGKAFGKASVTIDGVSKGTVDLYTATAKGKVLETYGGLSAGAHTMVIQVLGTKNASATGTKVVVDGFTIHA